MDEGAAWAVDDDEGAVEVGRFEAVGVPVLVPANEVSAELAPAATPSMAEEAEA